MVSGIRSITDAACAILDNSGSIIPYILKPWEWKQERWTAEDIPNLRGKVAIVTGGNGGIGLETCYSLVRHGAHVYLGARSEEKFKIAVDQIRKRLSLNPLPKLAQGEDVVVLGKIEYLPCDLTTMEQADQAAQEFLRSNPKSLDIFVACAGKGSGKSEMTKDKIETFMATNTVNHMVMLRRLLPLIKKSSEGQSTSGRIVFISSCAHRWCTLPWPISIPTSFSSWEQVNDERRGSNMLYSQSKLAQILLIKWLDLRLHSSNIACVALHPGEVNNNFVQQNFVKDVKGFHILRLAQSFPALLDFFLLNSIEGARTGLFAATSEQIDQRKWSGAYLTYPCQLGRPSPAANDIRLAERCWRLVQTAIDEKFGKADW